MGENIFLERFGTRPGQLTGGRAADHSRKKGQAEQIRRQDRLLTISWYAVVFAVSIAIVNQLIKEVLIFHCCVCRSKENIFPKAVFACFYGK